jgi:diguanylate cyclase (GGDEF)-like protein
MIDIDHFKRLNDTHGHPAGDAVLRKLGDVLHETLRAEDVLARYGGEEFAVLARGIAQDGAVALGERLRKVISQAQFGDKTQIPLTVSIGVAVHTGSDDDKKADPAAQLVELADAALYRAKQAGRNRVEA